MFDLLNQYVTPIWKQKAKSSDLAGRFLTASGRAVRKKTKRFGCLTTKLIG
jgi:hypothetical protein